MTEKASAAGSTIGRRPASQELSQLCQPLAGTRRAGAWIRPRAAVVVLAASLLPLLAQTPTASLTGLVTDAQGAAVAGATVEATNTATNLTYRSVSGSDGFYLIPNLPIGSYTLSVTLAGFKSFRRTGLTLEVAQRLRVDPVLEVGAVTETVNVTGEISRVQTEESSLGTVVERKRIEDLPLNGRHVFNLVKVIPGVTPRSNATDGFAEVSNQVFSQLRINGGPAYGNQFFLDGVSNSAAVHNEISVVPAVDTVEEFRVETNALKAEYGQTAGGVVNVVTRSGGNQFHGSLYEFLRNDALDARNAFSTQPDPRTGRLKQVLRYNQYGGTLGGPVWIPKLYNGRNRTFFFAAYEQWRWRSTGAPRIATVATPAERNGDFSNTRDARGNVIPLFDPATTTALAGGGFSRQPLPGNRVPASRQDRLALRVLPFMPLPNAVPTDPFTNANNFVSLAGSSSDQGVTSIRLDHRLSERDSIFGRYSSTRNTLINAGWGLGVADPAARNDQRNNHNGVINYTRVFSPTILNTLQLGATRQWLPFLHPSFDQGWPQRLGYSPILPQDQFPPVQITGLLTIGSAGFSGGLRAQQIIQVTDSFSWTLGRHNLKMGADLRWWRLSFINRLQPSGVYNFTPALTGNPLVPAGTGFGLASFLLGEVQSGNLGFRPFFQFRANPLAFYLQDDWKLTNTLTLNLGLRYDLSVGPTELHNRYSTFDPFIDNPETRTPGRMFYASVDGRPRTFVDRDNNNFGPRVGFAWNPGGKNRTAVRGGYGLIYLMAESGNTVPDNASAFGFSIDTPFVAPGGGPFRAFAFADGPPSLLQPLGAAGGPSAFRGFNVRYQDRDAPVGYMQQWNFAIQQQLWGGWTATAVYAGSKGTKLFGGNYDLNQLDPRFFSEGLRLQELVTNPYFGQITSGALAAQRVQRQQLLRPFPDYLSIETWGNNNLDTNFHSLQLFVEKRFSQGVSALFSYTKSKLITGNFAIGGGNSGNAGVADYRIGAYNRRIDRAIDQDDVSDRLVASGLWELPVGRGRRFGASMPLLLNAIAGGWQLNGIWTVQTGTPLVVRGSNNFTGIPYPDVVGDPTLPKGERSVARWFNTDVFRNPPDFTIGNAPRVLPRTRAPGLNDLSFSVFKTFRFQERFRLEARGELFNALNTVNYNAPNVSFSPDRTGRNVNANFGRILGALDARRIQLGLRLAF